ncbi:Nitroreductase family protein [Chitinispirillum alkaliphilum]|nr:Nitroreductase family protein [Chitinispirillum alkaliphilum]
MEFSELLDKRYSVRSYKSDDVEEEKLLKVLDAGRRAPSAVNNQPWFFIVCSKEETKAKLRHVYDREWFVAAPVIIAVCIDREVSWKRKDGKDYGDVDAAIALDHMTLQAAELGLGTCWIGNFYADKASEALNLPSHVEPLAFTPLGYPDQLPAKKGRKSLEDIVCWEKFDK